jgi:zinc transporter, ZIP family
MNNGTNDMSINIISVIGFVFGLLGTGLGGVLALFIKSTDRRKLGFMIEMAAGLMLSVICFELIPEALVLGGLALTSICFSAGIIMMMVLDEAVKRICDKKQSLKNRGLFKVGVMTAIGLSIHNFPEGFAVGSGFMASIGLGITLLIVIIFHDIPEGMAISLPLKAGGVSSKKAFVITLLSGIPMGFGAIAGGFLGSLSLDFICGCLAFAGGTMLWVVFGEMLPESKNIYKGRWASVGGIIGFMMGAFISII